MARDRGERGERWIVLHDGMPDHPKVEDLSDKAFRALVGLWCWCGRQLTDGQVTAAVWKKRAPPAVQRELVAARLVDVHPDGSVEMHDYLDWQRSAAEVEQVIETKKAAGRRGNHTRWHVKEGRFDPECDFCTADIKPDPSHPGSQPRSHMRSQNGSQNVARDRDRDRDRGSNQDLGAHVPDRTVVELHAPLRSAAASGIAPLRSAIPDPSKTGADFPCGPSTTRSVNATP